MKRRSRKKTPRDTIGLVHPEGGIIYECSHFLRGANVIFTRINEHLRLPGWYFLTFYPLEKLPSPMNWVNKDNTTTIVGRPRRVWE